MANSRWNVADYLALAFSLLAVIIAFLVHDRIFERMAHLEDEMAYLWQAQAIAGGHLSLPSPPSPKSFLVPFVVDHNGQRFGKYPLGWPVVLGIGEYLGGRAFVNPLLTGFGLWLIYLLGKRVFGETAGVLGAGLTLTSPFFWMNSGSLLSHPLGLVLSVAFVLAWMDAFIWRRGASNWLPTWTAAAALGLLTLTRPFTALAVGLPFAFHGLYLFLGGDADLRRRLILVGGIALLISSLHFAWQYAVTGDFFLNPYTLWWEYDKVGFGPGVGRIPGGHTLDQAWVNTRFNIYVGRFDLFGWAGYSWILLPFGLFAMLRDRNRQALLPISVFISLFILYQAYWIGAWVFGPRYYYEGLFSLTLLSAAGFALLAGWPTQPGKPFPNYPGWGKFRPLALTALLSLLVALNLIFYLPARLSMLSGLYGVQRAHLDPFLNSGAQKLAPALIIVHTQQNWIEYGTLLELQTPFLDTPFIFIYSRGVETDASVAALFPERAVYHYYPRDNPYVLYTAPRQPN